MSLQELSFGVLWQRVMYQPLRVRLFYGHPDVANKVFFTTRGGFAKASKIVNVSEDVFGGFIAALRGGGEKRAAVISEPDSDNPLQRNVTSVRCPIVPLCSESSLVLFITMQSPSTWSTCTWARGETWACCRRRCLRPRSRAAARRVSLDVHE